MYFPENSVTRLFSLPSPQHSNATWSFDAWCVDVLSVVAVERKNYCPAWKAIYKSRFFQKVIKLKQIKILVFRQTRAQTHTPTRCEVDEHFWFYELQLGDSSSIYARISLFASYFYIKQQENKNNNDYTRIFIQQATIAI